MNLLREHENIEDAIINDVSNDLGDVSNDSDITQSVVDEKMFDKKTESDLIRQFLKPNSSCVLCSTPLLSIKINKSFLDGMSYQKMIEVYSEKFLERSGKTISVQSISKHFKFHFDVKGFAIAEYNRERNAESFNIMPTSDTQRDIFKLTTKKYIDELEMFDTTAKELVNKYKELEDIVIEKRLNGKTFGIDELILKQAQVLNVLNKQAISKFKALSKVDLESKQGQLLSQLSFIGNKAIAGATQINGKNVSLEAKQVEELYLSVVIRQILARLDDPLKVISKDMSKDQKSLFYRELKKSMEGIQLGINIDFENQIKIMSQKSIENKKDSESD